MPCKYKDYPKNWKTEIRPAVLARAGEIRSASGNIVHQAKCENVECGVINNSTVKREKKWVRIVLTIAHLDHDKHNHDVSIDRLRAWCQKCHLNYDREHHMANARETRNKKKNQAALF